MLTIQVVLERAVKHLEKQGIPRAKRQAEDLLSFVLCMSRMDLCMEFQRPLEKKELDRCREALKRRSKGEPLQYIQGKTDFYGCRIYLSPDVLIPRQETEILVDKIAEDLSKENSLKRRSLWDVCCGSGCIGIALKKKFPELDVVLSDLSEEALEVAKKNAQKNSVEVTFLQGDLLNPFLEKRTDYFVCNPPYISKGDYFSLEREVREFEPKQALVGGESGLEFYENLAKSLDGYLNPGGKVWFEIGSCQGEAVSKMFASEFWKSSRIEEDWGGHQRFFFLEKQGLFM